jgi:hypothetical protein
MMETYEKNIMVRLSLDQRAKALMAAKDGDSSVSDIVRRSLDFYLAFPQGFLEQMQKVADEAKLPMPTVVVHLLQVYASVDTAVIKNFGISNTFQRAFRFTPEGKLIEGDELGEILAKESDELAKELRRKLEQTKRTGKPARITREEIPIIPALM